MEPFFISAGSILLAEMADKSQFLALSLALRYSRHKFTIISGILLACLLNHLLSSYVGVFLAKWLTPTVMGVIFGIGFIVMGILLLLPQKAEEEEIEPGKKIRYGLLASVCLMFFLAETGDKTQVATMLMASQYPGALLWIVLGSTLGMVLANVPVVYLGNWFVERVPMKLVRYIACFLFVSMGISSLVEVL